MKDKTVYYNVRVILQDIFTLAELEGSITINGQSERSGASFRIENGKIESIDAQAEGYNPAYIVARNTAKEVIITRDREGYYPQKDIQQDITLYVQLIPLDFDTVLFAKSIGNFAGYGDDLGREPTQETIKNLKKAINMINQAAQGTMLLTYIGKVDQLLNDGVTHVVAEKSPYHHEDLSGNIINY